MRQQLLPPAALRVCCCSHYEIHTRRAGSLGWSVSEAGRYSSLEGACNLPGYLLASRAVRALGAVPSFVVVSAFLARFLWVALFGCVFAPLSWTPCGSWRPWESRGVR